MARRRLSPVLRATSHLRVIAHVAGVRVAQTIERLTAANKVADGNALKKEMASTGYQS
jgi:hypothetical protein